MSDNKVFVIFQNTADAQPFISAFEQENPQATLDYQPGMVRIEGMGELGITLDVVNELAGRDVDLQEMHLTLVSLSGNVDEDDDYFRISRH
ncbi:MAG: MmoB/DmpM family protein [Candidatus Thiothrix singaporensis]|uniref:MmoB/DmpM family protein n=1 Tax=Candidatus Thiothrix singaporensis TaxID=2799669 RepID=A0A7L6ATE7_9GAMM|nr:MAG: MmoB/DmpM family protein [Candidatus Thiothrix singaporensis]